MIAADEPTLADKVEFLSRPGAYPHAVDELTRRETHMSWVFLAGDKVYKLKKPVRFPYLDFSTLGRREAACRAEFSLNRRLAPDVYIGITPLVVSPRGLSLGGAGSIIDWLVVMHRLDDHWVLEHVLREGRLQTSQLDRLVTTLVRFYRRARPAFVSPGFHLVEWSKNLTVNRRVLLEARFGLPTGLIRGIDRIQRRFVAECGDTLAARVRCRRIVDGHGDLRPEHVWLDHEVRIIDCLEFNTRLRTVDPFDEARAVHGRGRRGSRRPAVEGLIITDTVPPFRLAGTGRDKLAILPAAPLLAEAIRRLHSDRALTDLIVF